MRVLERLKKVWDYLVEGMVVADPEIGEIWRFIIRERNPWKEDYISDAEIIDKKDGWVKYRNLSDDSIGTHEIGSFKEHRFKVEEGEEQDG
jgi:hypothetical protein